MRQSYPGFQSCTQEGLIEPFLLTPAVRTFIDELQVPDSVSLSERRGPAVPASPAF
jgi:hypothetical protein